MLSVNEIQTDLEAIANELDQCDGSTATLLRDLSYALRGGPQMDAWTTSNIYLIINPATIVELYKNQPRTDKLIATLEWIRNSLIFAPLVLTWLGISQAVDKYKLLIDADHNQISQPFIFLWQQGFGNRLPWFFTLSSVAIADFTVLLSVLFLTVMVYSLSSVVKLRREQEANNLRSKLSYALACASLWLTTKGSSQPTNFVDRFNQASQDFNQVVSNLLKQVNALADRQKKDWQTFDTLRTQLSTMVTTVTTAVTEMKASNETLSRAINGLVVPARDIVSTQKTLISNTQQAIDSIKDQTTAQGAVVKEMQVWGTALQATLTKLDATVKASEDLTKDTGVFTKKQTDLIAAMERERLEQAEISNRVLMATDSLKRIVQEIKECAIELRGWNVQMNDLVRRVAAIR